MSYRRYRLRSRRDLDPRVVAAAAGVALALATGAAHASTSHHHHHHPGPPPAAAGASAPAGGSNKALGKSMAAAHGWTGWQWTCLDWLWTRESGWSATAENTQSGAYGIAQALGHGPTNQYPAGPANPPRSDPRAQIRWGLSYIDGRYGSPCGAWSAEEAQGWY